MIEVSGQHVAVFSEPSYGWVLRRMAEEVVAALPGAVIYDPESKKVIPRALNYFVNYAVAERFSGVNFAGTLQGGYFTHREEAGPYSSLFDCMAVKFDFCAAQNQGTLSRLMEIRSQSPGIIPPIKAIRPGHDRRVRKQGVVFGVVGRVYKSGRKGEHLVEELARSGRYNIVSWGKGWPCPELFEGSPWESLPEFYRSIDYLVVTSLNEGGPIPLIDAIAAGVPVIAPREVGWCSEFPVIEYAAGRLESLDAILFQLTHPPDWDEWRGDHVDLFRLAFAYGKVGLR